MAKRDLIRNLQSVTFERHNFARQVRQDTDSPQAQVFQDLSSDSAFVLDHALHARIAVHMLAMVVDDFGQRGAFFGPRVDAKAAPGVVQIYENSAVLRCDRLQRSLQHFAAIACARAEDIPRQAVRVDADERRAILRELRDRLRHGIAAIGKARHVRRNRAANQRHVDFVVHIA